MRYVGGGEMPAERLICSEKRKEIKKEKKRKGIQ